jgi:hypothetical protein
VEIIPVERGQKWEALKSAPRESLSGSLVTTTPPARVSRSVVEGKSGIRGVSLDNHSTIAYDPREHRFVNANSSAATPASGSEIRVESGRTAGASATPTVVMPPRAPFAPVTRSVSAPPARNIAPPPAPRYSGGSSSAGSRGGSWGGSASSSGSSAGRASAPSAPSSHPSGGRH